MGINFGLTIEERFWLHVDKREEDECWSWTAHLMPAGYGQIWADGKMRLSHRVVWELTYGKIPDRLCVCHHCDNPACVNPKHLFLGTVNDNNQDREKKGRGQNLFGSSHPCAKLNEKRVEEIRNLYSVGISQAKLTKLYGVGKSQINRICQRKNWTHL